MAYFLSNLAFTFSDVPSKFSNFGTKPGPAGQYPRDGSEQFLPTTAAPIYILADSRVDSFSRVLSVEWEGPAAVDILVSSNTV